MSIIGYGVGLTKPNKILGLEEYRGLQLTIFTKVWPVLVLEVGLLLLQGFNCLRLLKIL
jgi:hypothetical protein